MKDWLKGCHFSDTVEVQVASRIVLLETKCNKNKGKIVPVL